LAGDSVSREIARTKNASGFSELRDFGDGFYNRHYSILHNVGDYAQVPTIKKKPTRSNSAIKKG
jgi:hypothetical protein